MREHNGKEREQRRLREQRVEQTIAKVMDDVLGRKKQTQIRKAKLSSFLEQYRKCGKTESERREIMRIRWYVRFFKRPAFISWSVWRRKWFKNKRGPVPRFMHEGRMLRRQRRKTALLVSPRYLHGGRRVLINSGALASQNYFVSSVVTKMRAKGKPVDRLEVEGRIKIVSSFRADIAGRLKKDFLDLREQSFVSVEVRSVDCERC